MIRKLHNGTIVTVEFFRQVQVVTTLLLTNDLYLPQFYNKQILISKNAAFHTSLHLTSISDNRKKWFLQIMVPYNNFFWHKLPYNTVAAIWQHFVLDSI
jgi:hypothetical protein